MTFAHDEETAGKSDGDEASAETASLPPAQADGAAPGDPPTRGSGPDASRSASSEAQDDAQDTQSMTAAASPEARSDEVDSGIVELIDATPTPVMLPIPGTSKVKHLEENIAAASIELTEQDRKELSLTS